MSDVSKHTADPVPATIGRYQITGSLGFGAMGAVYKAFDPLIRRTLAIKTVRLDIPRSSPQYRSFIDRFHHEAQISGTLSHPGIVTLFDLGEENGLPFFAMEFVDGRTIGEVLAEGTRFKPERVIGLVSQVAAALDYAHSRGVVHRDVKPANLILYEGDKVKVTDFGIAKLADADITHAGALLGTPSYMSPEQAMGERLDGRSDIFSLGVVAFEMLSGHQPFPGPNVTSILYKLVHVDPIEPADLELLGLVPQKWREVFERVLAKKPERRYQTASAFVQDLEYCLGSWFTGLGNQETVSLAAVADVTTPVEIPRPVPLRVPSRSAAAPLLAREEETTLVLDAPPSEPTEPPPLIAAAEVTAVMPALVTAEASQTQPPDPMLRSPPLVTGGLRAPASPRAARPAIPPPLVLGAGAVLFALIAFFAWALRPQEPVAVGPARDVAPGERAAPPPAAAVATPGKLRAVSEPAGVPTAERRLALKQRKVATTGAADFLSTPAGAAVSVDGKPAGQTPLRAFALQAGRRRVELALDGHETWSSTLDVSAGETGRVDVRLRPRPAAPPTPEPVDVTRVYPNEPGQVDTLARKLQGASPSYPSGQAPRLRSGQRVSVLVRFVVSDAGDVTDVAVVESAGRVLDDVVVAAIRSWKFEPATKRGVRVKVETSFRQTFLGA